MVVGWYQMFPCQVLSLAEKGFKRLCASQNKDPLHLQWEPRNPGQAATYDTPQACDGLNLITRMSADYTFSVDVMDMNGKSLHKWNIDWFTMWPEAQHLPADLAPQSPPGCGVHGAVLLENGNLVFNFDYLGLVCLDFDGNVVWRLPYQTHHSRLYAQALRSSKLREKALIATRPDRGLRK